MLSNCNDDRSLLPLELIGEIEAIDTFPLTIEQRLKYRFLSHLPVDQPISFVLLTLESMSLSEAVREKFKPDMKAEQEKRKEKFKTN